MAPLALIVVAAGLARGVCQEITSRTLHAHASADALAGLERFLDKVLAEVDFVSRTKSGAYRFWPRGTFKSVTYDGTLCTDLILERPTNSVTITTQIFVKNRWQTASTESYPASQLLHRLSRNDGTAVGIPLPLQREMAASSLHRRIVCGISLQDSPDAGDAPK